MTHYPETTALAVLAIAVAAAAAHPVLGVLATGAAIGVLMHLAADACTIIGPADVHAHDLPATPRARASTPDRTPGPDRAAGPSTSSASPSRLTVLVVAAIVYLQDGRAPELDWRIAAGAAAVLLLLTAPARALIRAQRVKVAWTQAVIHSGAADPPGKRSRKKRQLTGPRATSVRPVAVGDQVTVRISRGNSYPNLEQHRDTIRNNLDVGHLYNHPVHDLRLRPHPYRSSRAVATIVTRDPFRDAPPTTSPLVTLERTNVMLDPCPVGTFETGSPPPSPWAPGRAGHILICGITEGGKSAFAQQLIAHTALDPTARLILLDPQQTQFARWQSCAALPVVGANPVDAVRALDTVRTVLGQQLQTLVNRGTWTPTREDPTYTVVIDEAALYLRKDDRDEQPEVRESPARPPPDALVPAASGSSPSPNAQAEKCSPPTSAPNTRGVSASASTNPKPRKWCSGHGTKPRRTTSPSTATQGVGYLDTETDRPERFRGALPHPRTDPGHRRPCRRAPPRPRPVHLDQRAPSPFIPIPKTEGSRHPGTT